MQKLPRFQQFLIVTFLTLGGIWLCLSVAPLLITYRGGDDALAALLKGIAPDFGIAALGAMIMLLAILRYSDSASPCAAAMTPALYAGRSLKNLAIWIVIAVLLVVLFNVFAAGGLGHGTVVSPQNDQLLNMLINLVPIILMVGFWIFIMRRMQSKNKDKDKT